MRSQSYKAKAILVQVWTDPGGFQEIETARFHDNRHMQVVSLSALYTGRLYPLPPGNITGVMHTKW